MDTYISEQLPSALAIAILGETGMEHPHQVAQRIRENIDELLAQEERRQQCNPGMIATVGSQLAVCIEQLIRETDHKDEEAIERSERKKTGK